MKILKYLLILILFLIVVTIGVLFFSGKIIESKLNTKETQIENFKFSLGKREITFDNILGRSDPIYVGESIYYIGYPFLNLGLHNLTVSSSIISSKVKFDNETNQYQIDSIVHEGNSGGPLIDLKKNKVNVSKLIRDLVFKELTTKVDKRKKPTIEDLKRSLDNCF